MKPQPTNASGQRPSPCGGHWGHVSHVLKPRSPTSAAFGSELCILSLRLTDGTEGGHPLGHAQTLARADRTRVAKCNSGDVYSLCNVAEALAPVCGDLERDSRFLQFPFLSLRAPNFSQQSILLAPHSLNFPSFPKLPLILSLIVFDTGTIIGQANADDLVHPVTN